MGLHPSESPPDCSSDSYIPTPERFEAERFETDELHPGRLGFRLKRITRLLPGIKTAGQGMNIDKPVLAECLRHPGAGRLAGSRTVCNNWPVIRDAGQMLFHLTWRNA